MSNDPTSHPPKKRRYHHGDLQQAALRRGREIVAAGGPDALTLRGLARDLGVTAPALVYHFGSRAGMRSAVAASVLAEVEKSAFTGPTGPGAAALERVEAIGAAWIAFAERNPSLYRLASGEGWRRQPTAPNGLDPGGLVVPSPRRVLQSGFARQTRRLGFPKGDEALSEHLAFTIHGLALARMDGAGAGAVSRALRRLGTAPTG